MSLPLSFAREGFMPLSSIRKRRRLLISLEGPPDTGKSEFALSCPGPGIIIVVDRGLDPVLDNPNPPAARQGNFAVKVITPPLFTQSDDRNTFKPYYKEFRDSLYAALKNPDCNAVCIDGDSDSWELQRLAEFGTLTKVPGAVGLAYTEVNAGRRLLYARCWDAGKIVVATNKMREEYAVEKDAEGNAIMKDGKELKVKTGRLIAQGFDDDNYLWQIKLRMLYKPAGVNSVTKRSYSQSWGLRILRCKHDTTYVGAELWGSDCNFPGLVQTVYPDVPLKDWGL
jgi:hypothetical protein